MFSLLWFATWHCKKGLLIARREQERFINRQPQDWAGAAVLLSFLIVIIVAGLLVPKLSELLWGNDPVIGSIILGSIGIFVIGFLDDLARLSPKTKLFGEFVIAGLVVWGANLSFTSIQFLGLGSISFPEWVGFAFPVFGLWAWRMQLI